MSYSPRWAVLGLALTLSSQTFAAPPSDLVRLKNGGMVRGSIIELVPGSFVVVELKNGETRRFEMNDVEYAGPEDDCEQINYTLFGSLLGVGCGATIAGAFMFFKRDEAHIKSGMDEARARVDHALGGGRAVSVGQSWAF
jgi:hypothetical protein